MFPKYSKFTRHVPGKELSTKYSLTLYPKSFSRDISHGFEEREAKKQQMSKKEPFPPRFHNFSLFEGTKKGLPIIGQCGDHPQEDNYSILGTTGQHRSNKGQIPNIPPPLLFQTIMIMKMMEIIATLFKSNIYFRAAERMDAGCVYSSLSFFGEARKRFTPRDPWMGRFISIQSTLFISALPQMS